MSSLFLRYEEELELLLPKLEGLLGEESAIDDFSESAVTSLLEEAQENVDGMDMQLRNVGSGSEKTSMSSRLQRVKGQIKVLRARFQMKKQSGGAHARALLGEDVEYLDAQETDGQELIQETTRLMQKGSERVFEMRREMAEMEEIGVTIAGDLDEQRQTIEGMQGHVDNVNADLDRAEGLMAEMRRRLQMNKVIMGIGAACFFGAGGLVAIKWLI